jgi:hypothetical protein
VGTDRSDQPASVRRLTVAEAAQVLGISAEAVRGRIRRDTLPVEREGGTVYVLVDHPAEGRTTDDQPRTTSDQPGDRTDLLIAELQDRVRSLEDANRENRRIIAALTQRIPAIEAPPEPPEATTAATERPGRVEPQAPLEGPQAAAETPEERKAPWWRRMFGGRSEARALPTTGRDSSVNPRAHSPCSGGIPPSHRSVHSSRCGVLDSPHSAEKVIGSRARLWCSVRMAEGAQPRSLWRRMFGG